MCEPVDVPVNKRHLDMVYAHMRYSDKPFMGSVTHPERAADSVEMAKILFGADVVDTQTVMVSLINANSPMTFDATMLGALKVLRARQPGKPRHPVHPGRRDGAGLSRRHDGADARGGHGGHGARSSSAGRERR